MNIYDLFEDRAKKQRLDAKCWTGYHKAGTKVKGDTRVNNCVPNEGIEVVREFAPAGGGGSGDYFQALASVWYNGTFDTGSLQKGIKSQEDVERLLNRGIVCPDGKTRKLHIDYNSDFDGVEIYSDDYYEHGDESGELDSRTGQPWGPYDFMAFSDEDLSESINEFAPPGGDDGGPDEDEILFRLAKQWWLGTEQDMARAERTLASMGWEIGEDEGSYDDGGVFVVRAGDVNGRSYQSWPHEELVDEGATIATTPGSIDPGGAVDNFKQQMANNTEIAYKKGIAEAIPLDKLRSTAGTVKDTVSARLKQNGPLGRDTEKAKQNVKPIEKGMAEGSNYGVDPNNPWGPQGRFVGDTGPAQITTTVPRVQLRIGDRVMYKPTGQHAKIEDLNKDRTMARIHVASAMGGRTFNCKTADLKPIGQGSLEEKSTSQAQFRTMAAAAHNPEFAKKVGIKQSVAQEFHGADKKQSYKSLPKKVDEGIMDFMQPKQPKTTKDKLSLSAMRQIEKARADKERRDPTYVRSVDLPKNPDHVRVVTDGKGDYVPPKEADYGDDYQAMVRRVAAQEKRKQQQPKPKHENSNMPVAVDSTSPIHGTNEDSEDNDGISTKNVGPASQKLIRTARQAVPDARSDLDAVFAYLDDVAKRTQDNYGQVNNILKQLDPMSNDLDKAERELNNVRQVNQGQQQLLGRLKARLDKGSVDAAPAPAQQDKKDADERDAISRQLDQEPKQVVVKQEPQQQKPQGPDADTAKKLSNLSRQIANIDLRTLPDATQKAAKIALAYGNGNTNLPKATLDAAAEIASNTKPFDRSKIDAIKQGLRGTNTQNEDITEDIYESRLYKMKLAGYFD